VLAPALKDKLGALAGVPEAMIPAAAASAATAAAGLLSFNLAEVLVDGWRGHNELTGPPPAPGGRTGVKAVLSACR
jgi:hypothetical protein